MGERAQYSRVYWSVVDDKKFESIYHDNDHFATWVRLLMAADAIWPASPELPRSARKASVKALADVGLVDLRGAHHYRIHGLDEERKRRKEAATSRGKNPNPDGDQTDSERSPNGPSHARDAMLVSSSPSLGSARLGSTSASDDHAEFPAIQWLAQHRATITPNGGKLHSDLTRLVDRHGIDKVLAEFARIGDGKTPGQYVYGASNVLDPIPGAKQRKGNPDHLADLQKAVRTV